MIDADAWCWWWWWWWWWWYWWLMLMMMIWWWYWWLMIDDWWLMLMMLMMMILMIDDWWLLIDDWWLMIDADDWCWWRWCWWWSWLQGGSSDAKMRGSKRYKPWFQAIPRPIIIISWIITANYRKLKTISYIIWIIPIILDYLQISLFFCPPPLAVSSQERKFPLRPRSALKS